MGWIRCQGKGFVMLERLFGEGCHNPNFITTIEYLASRVSHADGYETVSYVVDSVVTEIFGESVMLMRHRTPGYDLDCFERDRLERLLLEKKPQPSRWAEMERSEEAERRTA